MPEENKDKKPLSKKPQKCYHQIMEGGTDFRGKPATEEGIRACARCQEKRAGRGKSCFREKPIPKHKRNQKKHEKKNTIQKMIESQKQLKINNPGMYANTYGDDEDE